MRRWVSVGRPCAETETDADTVDHRVQHANAPPAPPAQLTDGFRARPRRMARLMARVLTPTYALSWFIPPYQLATMGSPAGRRGQGLTQWSRAGATGCGSCPSALAVTAAPRGPNSVILQGIKSGVGFSAGDMQRSRRGRDAGYPAPHAQSRTGGFPAYAFHLGCVRFAMKSPGA